MYSVETAGELDVWLVKVPKYIANAWKNAPDRANLGKLQKNSDGSFKFVLDSKVQQTTPDQANQGPGEHKMSLQPLTHQRMAIISQTKEASSTSAGGPPTSGTSSGDKTSFEGSVNFRGELRPTGDMSYMNLKSSLMKQAAKPTKVTQILDKAVTSYKPRGAAQLAYDAELRKKKEEAKKVIREDKEVVMNRLFSAFEKQQYYKINELVKITNQPIPYLKEILKEICIYCSRSTHKNMWELKPEYRHYKS